MEHIGNLINLNKKRQEKESQTPGDQTATVVNKLFSELQGIFPAYKIAWPNEWSMERAKRSWLKAFIIAGITEIEQLQYGLKKCRLSGERYIPSVGEFIRWCTPSPEDIGAPYVETAYEEACRNSHPSNDEKKWSHQAVYHAWSMCNTYDLANLPRKNTFPIFERNYDITLNMIMRGEVLKKIPVAITHDKKYEPENRGDTEFNRCATYEKSKSDLERILGRKFPSNSYASKFNASKIDL